MAEIPIIDKDKNRIARLEWTGGLFQGKGVVRSDRAHMKEAKRIREMIAQRKDLENIQFSARNTKGTIRGWHGFEGTIQALNLTLPTIGYFVDWENTDWPVGSDKLDSEILE
jgi:hypothetical protein